MARLMSAEEAAAELGIQLATLYAYVSRGLLASVAQGASRKKGYHREEVEALKHRRERRRQPEVALRNALHLGEPLLESVVCTITADGPAYRGRLAVDLAREHTFEQVVALLWEADESSLFGAEAVPSGDLLLSVRGLPPLLAFQALLPRLTQVDDHSFDFRRSTLHGIGVRLMRLFAALAAGEDKATSRPVSEVLRRGWKCPDSADGWLNAALVLCADHELNVGTFTARCVASADAPVYAAINGAVSAFQGHRHGANSDKVNALWGEVQQEQSIRQAVLKRLRRGDPLPGFGHPLYPDGDPRASALLALVPVHRAKVLAETVFELTGQRPNLDFALVALTRHFNLPASTPTSLFAQGRLAGWMAHVVEQYEQGQMIRPRAWGAAPRPGD